MEKSKLYMVLHIIQILKNKQVQSNFLNGVLILNNFSVYSTMRCLKSVDPVTDSSANIYKQI